MAVGQGDSDLRVRLIASAARLLAEEGPAALSTRRVAKDAGTSTMAVYTYFGSIAELVNAVVDDGFARLAAAAIGPRTADPVADMISLGLGYVTHARLNPGLYTVMFGTTALGPFRPSTEQLKTSRREVFDEFVAVCGRAGADGRFEYNSDGWLIAHQLWTVVHGYVMLEFAGYVSAAGGVRKILLPSLEAMLVGLGATRADARAAIDLVSGALPASGS